MTFKTEEILDEYFEEIAEKEQAIQYTSNKRDKDYPHKDYDYSTDDQDDYEYQQDIHGG